MATLNSFGSITSQTGATVDYDQFFSGLAWDADSQLYYARARWYDPAIGGGFFGAGMGAWGQGISIADGLTSGYEIATGRMIGDGTLSSILHVGNLGLIGSAPTSHCCNSTTIPNAERSFVPEDCIRSPAHRSSIHQIRYNRNSAHDMEHRWIRWSEWLAC